MRKLLSVHTNISTTKVSDKPEPLMSCVMCHSTLASVSGGPYQTLTVQEGRASVPLRGPSGEVNHMVQVSGQIADVLLLFLQHTLVAIGHRLWEWGKKEQRSGAMMMDWLKITAGPIHRTP